MAIWMDLTNSLVTWNGGVVGIIRAELEIAKNLHALDKNIRFSVCTENGFREVKPEELDWLWNTDSVGDAYIKHFQRNNYFAKDNSSNLRSEYPALDNAYRFSDSRLERLKEATKLAISTVPSPCNKMLFYPSKLIYKSIKYIKTIKNARSIKLETNKKQKFNHPYKSNDIVFSCGWINSNKENFFKKIKQETKNFKIIYIIYDIIIIKEELKHFYKVANDVFEKYIYWVSSNCDMVIYGGKTAQLDTEIFLKSKHWRIPYGDYVKFGDSVFENENVDIGDSVLNKYNIKGKYIIAVGSIEPRKNYKTLYRAYCMMVDKYEINKIPTLVIVGKNLSENDLINKIELTPKVSSKIKLIQPKDFELDILYKNSAFVLLPSLYEGWSLTLPEGLNYKKLCLCSDVAPLREIADGIAEFISPLDAKQWAEAILKFSNDENLVNEYVDKVKRLWRSNSWSDTAKRIYTLLHKSNTLINEKQNILYYDITLLRQSAFSNARVSGILRTELLLLRYISRIYSNIKYFALTQNGYQEYDRLDMYDLLSERPIDESFENIKANIIQKEQNKSNKNIDLYKLKNKYANIFWLICSILPFNIQTKLMKNVKNKYKENINNINYDVPFTKNNIVISVGTGYDLNLYFSLINSHEQKKFKFVQLIYDYTPILVPQTHREATISYYLPFLKYSNMLSDVLFFGGRTAMIDGINYQISNNQKVRPSHVVKFGSNIVGKTVSKEEVKKVLEAYDLTGDFILTVGSVEARKNQEILYDAYINLIDQGEKNLPKLVICGYPGWKTGDFVSRLNSDERMKKFIIMHSFSDVELDILYRSCLFTVLPSLYEGWSLTLPESLNYGKFCIASDVAPLKEIGSNFIDYADPYDVSEWANKILFYAFHKDILSIKEENIKQKWHAISWEECAENVVKALVQLSDNGPESFHEGDEFINEK